MSQGCLPCLGPRCRSDDKVQPAQLELDISLSLTICSPVQVDWARLPADIWRNIARVARADWAPALAGRPKPSERWVLEQNIASALDWGCLVAGLAATCRCLREALLGPQASELWRADDFGGLYLSLAPKPRRWGRAVWDLAQGSQGLARLLARQGIRARGAVVRGGRWRPPELEEALSLLAGVDDLLQLAEVDDRDLAVRIAEAIAGGSIARLTYSGDQPFTFPDRLQELFLSQPLHASRRQPHFLCLQRLRQLRRLELDLPDLSLSAGHVHCLNEWHPHLQQLSLCLTVATWSGDHEVLALTMLAPSVQTSLQLTVHMFSGDRFLALLQQLRGVPLTDLSIACSSSRLSPAAEEHLAHCRVSRRLSIKLQGAPRQAPAEPASRTNCRV